MLENSLFTEMAEGVVEGDGTLPTREESEQTLKDIQEETSPESTL